MLKKWATKESIKMCALDPSVVYPTKVVAFQTSPPCDLGQAGGSSRAHLSSCSRHRYFNSRSMRFSLLWVASPAAGKSCGSKPRLLVVVKRCRFYDTRLPGQPLVFARFVFSTASVLVPTPYPICLLGAHFTSNNATRGSWGVKTCFGGLEEANE